MDKRCITMWLGLDWEKPNSRSDVFRPCDLCVCGRECSGWRGEGLRGVRDPGMCSFAPSFECNLRGSGVSQVRRTRPGVVFRCCLQGARCTGWQALGRGREERYRGRTGRAFEIPRAALSANGLSSTSSTSVEVGPDCNPLVDAHRRLIGEIFLLRGQMQDMVARRDLLVQQVKASTRWEVMKEWLEKRVEHWNPEEVYLRHLFLSGGISHQSRSFSEAATPRSVVGSRFSEEPSF
ncbi:hypothetical protein F2Q69_00012588 [Brassica cretica]|uniref:Uncharacterized protein n=1 Tax=Brassica cretica TaxID=69181 RepID=A0A8S9QPY0_BRACR|nr:hypothetical protein F2Q69_00012588 [Brassica cretica]